MQDIEQVETEVSKFENEDEYEEYEEFEDEKKKKAKKGTKRERKKKEDRVGVEIPLIGKTRPPESEPVLRIPGLKSVKLTSLTQKIMGCIVGEHVTAEAPWTTISKVVVDENLYLHHESSDFLPVKDDLLEYTDSSILVGYDPNYMPYGDEDFHRFYIAVTESAKNEVVSKLEEEKRLAEERLRNSVNKRVLPWESLGSETEVDDSIVKNTRPLIQLELETDIDEILRPVHFKDQNVGDVKDGYVRLGPGRQEFVGIPKLRVDASIQAVPAVALDSVQTDPGLPANAWTQYQYDMKTAEEALEQSDVKELKPEHVFAERDYLEKALEYNENFDLYVNDYPLLVLNEKDKEIPHKSVFEEYEAYTDVTHCKNKLITSIAWHPMWSGIVALAYSVAVRCVTAFEIDLSGDEVNRDVFAQNYVLLWSFKDALKPRLILESPREVYCIVWSPVDPNILVGGCASGQIIIWDLKGKLEAVEGHEYLTPDQQRYRLVMHSLIGWMQPQPPAQYVRPAALSNLQFSHSGKVTQIQFIPPYFEWQENGHYIKIPVEEGKISMQILSCGEDGVIMVWDLNKVPDDVGGPGRPKRRKTRKRPSALTSQISSFKIYDRKIRPIYILYPELPTGKLATKLTALSFRTYPVKYVPDVSSNEAHSEEGVGRFEKSAATSQWKEEKEIETITEFSSSEGSEREERSTLENESGKGVPAAEGESRKTEGSEKKKERRPGKEEFSAVDSMGNIREDSVTFRRIYKACLEPPEERPPQVIQVTTDEGDSVSIRWEGFDYHKGEQITTEQGNVLSWGAATHDGPVVSCSRSPFINDLFLTVGGSVIAMWKDELKHKPLFWKYCPVGVTCGAWSPYRPCLFHIGRSDGSLEVWDLTRKSHKPCLVQSISGKVLTNMSEHTLPLFGDRSLLGVADYNKSFRLLYFPDEYKIPKPDELQTLKNFVNREVYLRQAYASWVESFIISNAEELAKMKAKDEEAERRRKEAELAAEQETQHRVKMEEEEAKRLSKGRQGSTMGDRFLDRLRQEREKQMQRVLMEKKQLNQSDLLAKQQPILVMKQMEKEKRKKQKEKIRHQQKIFDKTVAMLFPEVVEKPQEGPSRMDEFEAELTKYQPVLMTQYDSLLPDQLKHIQDNPFNKRLKWEKVFEEGMLRRNVLDFPLYLRQKRRERYMKAKAGRGGKFLEEKKSKVAFKGLSLDGQLEGEEESEGEAEAEEEEENDEEKKTDRKFEVKPQAEAEAEAEPEAEPEAEIKENSVEEENIEEEEY